MEVCDKIHKLVSIKAKIGMITFAASRLWRPFYRCCCLSPVRRCSRSPCWVAPGFWPPAPDGGQGDAVRSGMDPIHDARRRFDVRFHLVAIAFLVFDVELLFLYPWAVASREAGRGESDAPRSIEPVGMVGLEPRAGVWRGDGVHRVCWRWALSMPGGKGCFDGDRAAGKCRGQPARLAGQLVPQEQPVADAVRHGLLRHRADGHRRQQVTTLPGSAPKCFASARGSAI